MHRQAASITRYNHTLLEWVFNSPQIVFNLKLGLARETLLSNILGLKEIKKTYDFFMYKQQLQGKILENISH